MNDDIAFAWAAGIFEGEGTLSFGPRSEGKGGTLRRASVGMTDGDVVQHFYEVVGVGHLNGPYARRSAATGKEHKPMYFWTCQRWPDLEGFLRRLEPFLGQRRGDRAREMLATPLTERGQAVSAGWNKPKTD